MVYDYSSLKGKIKERYDTQNNFAKAVGLSSHTISHKLNGKIPFNQDEMQKICNILDIRIEDSWSYFFKPKVQC